MQVPASLGYPIPVVIAAYNQEREAGPHGHKVRFEDRCPEKGLLGSMWIGASGGFTALSVGH